MTDLFDYNMSQAAKAANLAINDEEIHEALTNSAQWADITLDRLIDAGVPAIHASGMIVATINTTLNAHVLQPPKDET